MGELPPENSGERPTLVDAVEGLYTVLQPQIAIDNPERIRAAAQVAVDTLGLPETASSAEKMADAASRIGAVLFPERTSLDSK